MTTLPAHILQRAAQAGSLRRLARDLGVSLSHLSRVAKGARPGPKLLKALGWTATTVYAPAQPALAAPPRGDPPSDSPP